MANEDLLKDTSVSYENGNYFIVTLTDLNVNETYPIQFRWMYKDKAVNPNWSAVKLITTPGESEPNTPKFTSSNVDVTQPEKIIITWDGTSDDVGNPAITNYDRVDIYIDGAPFDGTKAAYSFKSPGTTIIPAPAGTYQIVLYAVSKIGTLSPVSAAVTKTVTAIGNPITDPEDPDTPTIKAGLASVIVSWNGKKSGGGDLTATGFAGAKVYIGTTSNFTPSDNNWVHTLNFVNGSNQVSIGVGTVINKSTGATLAYGTPYYIKLGTLNASGSTTGNYVVSDPTNITVSKLPASEISTGILSADASITAGASSGARVVMSGSTSPFIIYGTDGSTKLLEFIGGSTGTLAINGGGTFTGDLSAGSGNSIFKADSSGIYLGNATYASAPFSVSRSGVLKSTSGTIGGWTLGSTYFQGNNLKLDTSGITVGATSSSYFDISPSALTHRNADGTASGKFTLTLGSSPQLTIDGTLTVGGSSVATSSQLSGYATTGALSAGLGTKIGASDVNSNVTSISGGVIKTGSISSTGYADNDPVDNFSSVGMKINLDNGVIQSKNFGITSTGSAYFKGDITGASGSFSGSLNAATGTFAGSLSAASGTFTGSLTSTGDPTGYAGNTLTISGGKLSADKVIYLQADISTGVVDVLASRIELEANTKVTGTFQASGTSVFLGTLRNSGITAGTYNSVSWNSGNNAFYQSPSSIKYKDNIELFPDKNYLGIVQQMNPVYYTYKEEYSDNPTRKEIGLIAEDVLKIIGAEDLVIINDNGSPETIMYDKIGLYLIESIKEISNTLNLINARLDALEG